MRFEDKLKKYSREQLWQEYCGFLDMSLSDYMYTQRRLMEEQLALWSGSGLGRQLLKGFQHVLHAYEARVAGQRGIVHDGRFAARLQGGQRKLVAVEAFAAQGKVELAGSRLARVGGHLGVLPVEAIELF